jgi:dTDP-L-rhamnose 4-epimerase
VTGPVLVTGGLGFIGSHVVAALLAAGREVRVLDVGLGAAHAVAPPRPRGVEVLDGDLRDPAVVERAVRGAAAVSHQAAMVGLGVDFADVADYVSHNDLGTAVLLRALAARRFGGRLVLAGSMVVYGEGSYRCPVDGAVRPGPRDPAALRAGAVRAGLPEVCAAARAVGRDRGRAGRPAQRLRRDEAAPGAPATVYGRECGVPVVRLRYHNVYGPLMPRDTPYAGVASIFRSALEAGTAPRVFEDGGQRRDFVHVRDVARANVLALADGAPAGVFNVASGEPHTVGELATALTAALRPDLTPVVTGAFRLGDVRHIVASPARARDELGFSAQIRFAAGMEEFARAPLRAGAAQRPDDGDGRAGHDHAQDQQHA